MELNLRWMMATMRSISLGEMGRVRDCSLSRFITWLVNSLHAWTKERERQTGVECYCKERKKDSVQCPDIVLMICRPQLSDAAIIGSLIYI